MTEERRWHVPEERDRLSKKDWRDLYIKQNGKCACGCGRKVALNAEGVDASINDAPIVESQQLVDDVARVDAARALVPVVRVDANGGWTVEEAVAAAGALTAAGPLEYLEQPCATVAELAELRTRIDVPIAADESIRKAEDPLLVVRSRAADVAVVKVAPLGGVSRLLGIADQLDIPIVVSSALDSAIKTETSCHLANLACLQSACPFFLVKGLPLCARRH